MIDEEYSFAIQVFALLLSSLIKTLRKTVMPFADNFGIFCVVLFFVIQIMTL